tara:strand:+ start:6459 stop:6758 length:300 start_codon:yes stop_codon:yes gene_type:complete
MSSNKSLFDKLVQGDDIGPDLRKTLEILQGLLLREQISCAVTIDSDSIEYVTVYYDVDRTFAENFLRLYLEKGKPSLTEAVGTAEADLLRHLKTQGTSS